MPQRISVLRARFPGRSEIIDDEDINLVLIGTHNNLHAELATRALESGKHVFVEKPLALHEDELEEVIRAASISEGRLMVGFNRRFSPLAVKAKEFFSGRRAPLSILYRVNAGRVSPRTGRRTRRKAAAGLSARFVTLWT